MKKLIFALLNDGDCVMTEEVKTKLLAYADVFHRKDFITNDPVQFPHRFTSKQDIEISGLLTALLSFGNRNQILNKAENLHETMGESPYEYVMSRRWVYDFPQKSSESYYRMLSYADINQYFMRIYNVYSRFKSLEDALQDYSGIPMKRFCAFWGVSDKNPQKKINMFLRWMIRRDSEVDFGLWKSFSPSELIIPLDTHVCHMAYHYNLTETKSYSLKNAYLITTTLNDLFPGDPCLGDFALFGMGVNGMF